MRAPAILLSVLLILACSRPVLAHGVYAEVSAGATTVVTVAHDDGSPLADTPFTVLAPGGGAAFLSGRTDSLGRVVFQPDRAGAWKVRVAAVDGHGAVVTVDVDSAAIAAASLEGAPAVTPVPAATEHDHDHAHDHDHDHAHTHDHAHDHDQTRTGNRWSGAVAGLVVLLLALGAGGALLRRRRG
jgi:hypothetical protein